jgi:hypothetical protein
MVNNQEWFNERYSEEIEEIEIEYEDFEGQLVVENYSKLEKLYLLDGIIDKVALKDLPQLQECTIRDCKMQDLVIENCPQLRKLNVRSNCLTNLGFLENLENLKELEIDDNAKLIEILDPYKGNWKACRENIQELIKLVRESPYKLVNLAKQLELSQRKYNDLKKFLKGALVSVSQEAKEELVDELNKKIKRKDSISGSGNTQELKLIMEATIESVKELREELKTELSELQKQYQEKQEEISRLEFRVWELTELSEQQGKQINAYLNYFDLEKGLLRGLIKKSIEFARFKNQEFDSDDYYEKSEKYQEEINGIKKQLKEKLEIRLSEKKETNKTMSKISRILDECEKMVNQRLELEDRLGSKVSSIEDQKRILSKEPDSKEKDEKIHQLELELAKTRVELDAKKEENSRLWERLDKPTNVYYNISQNATNYQIQYNDQRLQNELTSLKQKYQELESAAEKQINKSSIEITPQEKQIIKQTIAFLDVKRQFINIRKGTIQNLQNFYNEFQVLGKKTDKLATIGNIISGAGGGANSILPGSGTPVKLVGKILAGGADIFKGKKWEECVKVFQNCLLKDKSSISLFSEYHDSLRKTAYLDNDSSKSKITADIVDFLQLVRNKTDSFGDKHSVAKISEDNGFWKGKNLDLVLMDKIITALHEDLNKFKEELQQEENQCYKRIEEVLGKEFIKELAKPSTDLLQNSEDLMSLDASKQTAQILQSTQPYGTPSSSKN